MDEPSASSGYEPGECFNAYTCSCDSNGRGYKGRGKDIDCYIKWPNDIVVNGKKITGILTEMSAEMDLIHYVVIGIGINVNTTEFDEE